MGRRQRTTPVHRRKTEMHLFCRRGVLGDGLGAFRHGVLGQFTGEDEPDRGLDLARRDRRLLVVGGKLRGFGGNTLEDVYLTR